MSSILIPRLATPSYKSGYARSRSESANAGLWKDMVFANAMSLGPTGGVAKDVSGYGRDGVLLGDPATDWVMTPEGWAIDFDGSLNNTQGTGPSGQDFPFAAVLYCESDITNYTSNGYAFHQYESASDKRNWAIIARASDNKWSIGHGALAAAAVITRPLVKA